ncbi:aminotransferase class V-fold PLP-dependent enzyme [Streptomyces sp. HNM0575]|uniref:aminotransferase class V-fold PLP-dependent enzyme n=1 Tax=Streptomyces sp. HNM0575 TaxID=2716338 RepID=UPI00145DFBAD|nr:aminotransferase class V-fold PLP-dependent enzyme [Streptomyces sp. HNM0575]NLU74083.1 aminotransferase class V-fold PLP-dependent enzyme [Streptomyces sp. HNM0575]
MQTNTTPADGDEARGQARLALAQQEFDPDVVYLNTASLGLPPRRSLTALRAAEDEWRKGTASPSAYDRPLAEARASYAGLVGADPSSVAVGSQVSAFVGLVAASLPEGSEVLTAAGEFTSVVFPFHAQAPRGVRVREVPLEDLADEVTSRTSLVAVAAVQSADGRVARLDALRAACEAHGARVLLDTTQATGWLPVDASRYAYTVNGGYKWLLAPRGTCFFTVRPEYMDDLTPHSAGWFAGEERWESLYGAPLRLAKDARRFDVSPVWHAWVGQARSLELLTGVGTGALHRHALRLANRFRAAVGLPDGDSAVVSAAVAPDTARQLERAGVVGSTRAGRLRLAFHLYNTEADADRAAEVVAGRVVRET